MSKPPANWIQDLGEKAQMIWDFALETCKKNGERETRRRLRKAREYHCPDCDSLMSCDKCYRFLSDRTR